MASTGATTESAENTTSLMVAPEVRHDLSDSGQLAPCQIYKIAILIVVSILVGLLGLIGNGLSSVILWQDKKKTATIFVLLCLAVVDSFVIVVWMLLPALPIMAYYTANTQYLLKVHAYIIAYGRPLGQTGHMMTTWLTVMVATQRYVAVCRPYHVSKYGTLKAASWQVVGVITFTLSFNVVGFFEQKVIETRFGRLVSVPTDLDKEPLYNKLYKSGFYNIFIYVCPLLILTKITYSLKKALGKSMKLRQGTAMSGRTRKEDLTVTLLMVILVFIVCQLINPIRSIWFEMTTPEQRVCGTPYDYFAPLVPLAIIFNSSFNFVIYILFAKRFRKDFICLVRSVCTRRCNMNVSPETQPTTGEAVQGHFKRHTNKVAPVTTTHK